MIFKVGNHSHPANEVNVTGFVIQRINNRRGYADIVRKTLSIAGELIPASPTQAGITSAIQALEGNYDQFTVGTVGLYHDDGSTPTPHVLDAASSESGIRVKSLSYPKGDSAEYATARSFAITLEADYADPASTGIQFWQETISATGNGGPRDVLIQVDAGPPVVQRVSNATPCFATQQGVCVGRDGWLSPPAPLWPNQLINHSQQVSTSTPGRRNGAIVDYPARWSYQYQSPIPIFGGRVPTII